MTRRPELLAGSVVLLGLVVAVFGTFWLQGRRFGSTETEVHVLMRDVGQLSVGNAVTFRGVPIGRVGEITVEGGGAAVRIQLLLEGEWILDDDADDASGHLAGIEILDAVKQLGDPAVFKQVILENIALRKP